MRVAIVGSRGYWPLSDVRDYVFNVLDSNDVVVSGGAPGVDSETADAAIERMMRVAVHYADWQKNGRVAGAIRNAKIVADCDRVAAFWDGRSKGTMITVNMARKAGKPVELITMEET